MKFDNASMAPLRGTDYLSVENISSKMYESPVLDLSCKKSPSPPSYYEKDVSPTRDTAYLKQEQENNNNNNSKHVNSYHHAIQEHEGSKIPPNGTYHNGKEETPNIENRSYIITPPLESDSPKKARFQSMYEEKCLPVGENKSYPSYPMLPINVPMPLPVSMPSALPILLSQNNVNVLAPQVQVPTLAPTHDIPQSNNRETKKLPRPFKAYTKDSLSVTLGSDLIFDGELKSAFCDFRTKMLETVRLANEGTNIKMRRTSKGPMPTSNSDDKDSAYWERRRKNNEAAKRSRDARRAKEDDIAIRAAFLEQEFLRLKHENRLLKEENSKIKTILYRTNF